MSSSIMLYTTRRRPLVFGCMHLEIGKPHHRRSNRQQLHGQTYAQAIRAVHKCTILNSALPSSSPSQTESSLVHKLINPTLQLLVHCIRQFLHQTISTCQACAAYVITHTMSSCFVRVCFNKWATTASKITTETTNKVSHALQQASEPDSDEQAVWAPSTAALLFQQQHPQQPT